MPSVDENVVSGLIGAIRSLRRPIFKHVSDTGLTPAQFMVLERLLNKGPGTVNQIIADTLSTSGNVGLIVNNLIDADLVEKSPNPADGRSRLISLTAKGDAKIRDYYPRHKAELRRLMSSVSRDDKKNLIKALSELRRSVDEQL